MTQYAVAADDAIKRLKVTPDYDDGGGPRDCVHTLVSSAVGLLGAHWGLEEVCDLSRRNGAEEAGPDAASMGHGLVVWRDDKAPLFVETLPDERNADGE